MLRPQSLIENIKRNLTMRSRTSGMTLIELMIVVAIVGILASVAYPSYLDHIRRARRADAQSALLQNAQFLERYYTTNGRYVDAAGDAPALPITEAPNDGGTKYYDLSFSGNVDATTYTLQAVPSGAQASDPCGTLTITQAGLKGADAADCWGH